MSTTKEDMQLNQSLMPWAWPIASGIAVQSVIQGKDAHARLFQYIHPLEKQGREILQLYEKGLIGPHETVAHKMSKLRNDLMGLTREKLSAGGLALSEYLKPAPLSDADLRLKYSRELKAGPYSEEVSKMIMKKSIEPNPAVTNQAVRTRLVGITAAAIFPALSAFRIYKAHDEDRVYEMFRTGSEVVGGYFTSRHGVPVLWGACKRIRPGLKAKPALVLHVIFNAVTSTTGSFIGAFGADTAREASNTIVRK